MLLEDFPRIFLPRTSDLHWRCSGCNVLAFLSNQSTLFHTSESSLLHTSEYKVNTVNVVRRLPKNFPSKDFWPSLKMLWLQRFSFSVKLIFTVASICLQLKSKCTFKATTWILKLSEGPSIFGVDSFFRFQYPQTRTMTKIKVIFSNIPVILADWVWIGKISCELF